MKTIILNIPGRPVAKRRPRFFKRGKFAGAYNDQQTEEGRFLLEVWRQYDGALLHGALSMSVTFTFPRPKGHYGTGRNAERLKESAPKYHIIKPDFDNCLKFVKDCLNGVAYKDDAQVCKVDGGKEYSNCHEPMTRIFITELE